MSATSMTLTNNKVQSQQGLLSSSVKTEEETTMLKQKQGIITILDSNTASASSSLRRTLSADMSSKKWLSQSMKNIASCEELLHSKTIAESLSSSSSSSEDEENKDLDAEAERERLEIWSSIQRNKKEEQEKGGPFDTWSSIVSLKANDEISKSLPVTPYVHPLVKRSKSSLSEKSLEICTESLGSETGSDGLFSSSPSSETGDMEEEEEKVTYEEQQQQEEELQVPKYNYAATATKKLSTPRSFPPPLPSLSHHQTSPSLHMRSHRDNGRLVLQAVSVPSLNNFNVQRQEGRLVLTFANQQKEEEEEVEENDDDVEQLEEESFGGKEYYEGEEEEEAVEYESDDRDVESVMEKAPLLSSGISSGVRGMALMMNKPNGLVNRNPKWSEKFNEMTNFEDVNVMEVKPSQVAQSLPPRPRVARLIPSAPAVASVAAAAAAASFNFNAYEYYWRTKPPSKVTSVNPLDKDKHHQQNNESPLKSNKVVVSGDMNKVSNEQKQLLILRGKNGDYLVHNLKSCKDSRRSFLFWEPYCIATS
ncbi:protein FAF-like, chloroplastic [Abrus precatorius]|uniref:Protein FAF-like, chloroplastic n=1 Tax=Abrus precatorius TaxID=3816 RepID=A0A8B8KQV2_ABRPR|nr:protein FAF-like, chloroplastic [Abrus precatorius]